MLLALGSTALWRRARRARVSLLLAVGSLMIVAAAGGSSTGARAPERPSVITFSFAGDVMLGRGVATALGGEWRAALSDVRRWLDGGGDIAFANLESPLSFRALAVAGHDLRAPPESVEALQSAGIDIVSLANNHALDAGAEGLWDTVAALEAAGIAAVLPPSEARIAGEAMAHSGFPPFQLVALDDTRAPLDLQEASHIISAAAMDDRPVIVSVHWGGEYQVEPSDRQREIAQVLSSAGASAIVGHGPHVLQSVERVGDTVVAYSLGNLLFDQPYPVDCRWGAIFRVTFEGRRATTLSVVPTVTRRGRTRAARGDEALAILARLDLAAVPAARSSPSSR